MRFIKEYANEKKRRITASLMQEADKQEAYKRIDKAVRGAHNGLLTLDEAMMEIARS